jgi:hypothetical protein
LVDAPALEALFLHRAYAQPVIIVEINGGVMPFRGVFGHLFQHRPDVGVIVLIHRNRVHKDIEPILVKGSISALIQLIDFPDNCRHQMGGRVGMAVVPIGACDVIIDNLELDVLAAEVLLFLSVQPGKRGLIRIQNPPDEFPFLRIAVLDNLDAIAVYVVLQVRFVSGN